MIIIKKYPNRRLYNTSSSQYINLQDIRKMVIAQVVFKVVDSRSDADLTKNILLQIVTDQEAGSGCEILTQTVLLSLIRVYEATNSNGGHQELGHKLAQLLSAPS